MLNLNPKFFVFIICFLSPLLAFSNKTPNANIINSYMKELKQFRKKECTRNDSQKFWHLTRETNSGGYYIPLIEDEELDSFTLQKLLPEVRQKKQWIEENIKKVEKYKDLKKFEKKYIDLKSDLKILQGFKRKFYEEKDLAQKKAITLLSKNKLQQFYTDVRKILKQSFFLHTYRFPIDHKEMRKDYDSSKERKNIAGQRHANELFFMRKLVEDGVRHPKWRGNDRSIRTLINTVYIKSIQNKNDNFIDEDSRYDLDWLFDRLIDYVNFDKSLIVKRLKRWEESTEEMYQFYIGLLNGETIIDSKKIKTLDFLAGKGRSRKQLKEFVYHKQAEAYEYWSKLSKLNRVLYVMDTIILNEVGGTNDPGDLEKQEVLKVVFNRSDLKYYSSLSHKDSILEYLDKKNIKTDLYPWLNLLFKEGEFSFTYYFLPASNHIFCPDMSPRAERIRISALNLGLDLLKEKKMDTDAVRYFSRGSMLGRIDMTDLWTGFSSLPEKPGEKLEDKELTNKIKNHDYEFLYSFSTKENKTFQVVRIEDENYVLGPNLDIFTYRNPHNFRYFVEK